MLTEQFWSKVERTSDCWLWTAARLPTGYGVFAGDARSRYAHRLAYEDLVGPIPQEREIHHLCGQRSCVNPDHLIAVTRRQHRALDDVAQQAGRASGAARSAKTHCKRGHEFTAENTYVWRNKERHCRVCHRDRERDRRAA